MFKDFLLRLRTLDGKKEITISKDNTVSLSDLFSVRDRAGLLRYMAMVFSSLGITKSDAYSAMESHEARSSGSCKKQESAFDAFLGPVDLDSLDDLEYLGVFDPISDKGPFEFLGDVDILDNLDELDLEDGAFSFADEKKKVKGFQCPVCGSDCYTDSVFSNNYECDGCSVVFLDPKKFSVAQDDNSNNSEPSEA